MLVALYDVHFDGKGRLGCWWYVMTPMERYHVTMLMARYYANNTLRC